MSGVQREYSYNAIMLSAFLAMLPASTVQAPLPEIKVQGRYLVDQSGKRVILNGTNLGSWLMLEMWMLRLSEAPNEFDDQHEMLETLRSRFGEEKTHALMETYRASWMTKRDWDLMKEYKFNVIRLPIDYRLLEDDAKPMQLRPNAFKWIDLAVKEAEQRGIYTILDLHGAPGGQGWEHHTGRSGQNKLWGSEEFQKRTVWIWKELAKRYGKRSSVVAYDVLNEPWGGKRKEIATVFEKILKGIREVDADTLVYAPGYYDDFEHFPIPRQVGWKNVGVTMHFYPGLFGDEESPWAHARHFKRVEQFFENRLNAYQTPMLVGEMNVVLTKNGGAEMMRHAFDLYNRLGYQTTMWSHKVMEPNGLSEGGSWGMVVNRDPYKAPNFKSASYEELMAWAKSFATMPLQTYTQLRDVLTAKNPKLTPVPVITDWRAKAPDTDEVAGFKKVDIGGAIKGGLVAAPGGVLKLYGGGMDIWADRDQFRYLYASDLNNFTISTEVQSLENTNGFAKAAILVRSGLKSDSATVLVSVFPNGVAQVAIRKVDGGMMEGVHTVEPGKMPRKLGIVWRDGKATVSVDGNPVYTSEKMAWGDKVYAGVGSLSHEPARLAEAVFKDLKLVRE